MEPLLDPAEEARHRDVMHRLGVYDAAWALSKVLDYSDVMPAQNRLLLTTEAVLDSPIPGLFPELGADDMNAQHKVSFTLLGEAAATGRAKEEAFLLYLNSNMSYRIIGPGWRRLVEESGMSGGDRVDLYTCRRGDGERCCCLGNVYATWYIRDLCRSIGNEEWFDAG